MIVSNVTRTNESERGQIFTADKIDHHTSVKGSTHGPVLGGRQHPTIQNAQHGNMEGDSRVVIDSALRAPARIISGRGAGGAKPTIGMPGFHQTGAEVVPLIRCA